MNKEKSKRERVYASLPLHLLPKGHVGWIDRDTSDIIIVHNNPASLQEISLKRYIHKEAQFYTTDVGRCVKVIKTGDGFTGQDYVLDFSNEEGHILALYSDDAAQMKLEEDYLPGPVDVILPMLPVTADELQKKPPTANELLMAAYNYLEVSKFKSVEAKAYDTLAQLKPIAAKEFYGIYDDIEELEGFTKSYKEALNDYKEQNPCARTKFGIALYEALIDITTQTINLHKADQLKNQETGQVQTDKFQELRKQLENMPLADKEKLLNEKKRSQDFEEAAIIRDSINGINVSKESGYHRNLIIPITLLCSVFLIAKTHHN